MENLEKYIKDNLEEFNCGEMPAGCRERFMAKIAAADARTAQKKRRSHRIFTYSLSAAAVILLVLFVKDFMISHTTEPNIEVENYAEQMYMQQEEILNLIKDTDPMAVDEAAAIIEIITSESIPLDEQLPQEISQEQRALILKEYYQAKMAALKRVKTLYAQGPQEEEF